MLELTQAFSESNRVIQDAPVILIVCARAQDDVIKNNLEYFLFDVGLAVGNMVLAATDLGLVTHLMTAFDEARVKNILHIPDDVRAVVATPLAYPLIAAMMRQPVKGYPCAPANVWRNW